MPTKNSLVVCMPRENVTRLNGRLVPFYLAIPKQFKSLSYCMAKQERKIDGS